MVGPTVSFTASFDLLFKVVLRCVKVIMKYGMVMVFGIMDGGINE